MKNIIKTIVTAVLAVSIAGCDKLPTVEEMKVISTGIGKAAAFACELSKITPEVKENIIKVLDVAAKVVPEPGKTFTETWMPIMKEEVQKLVDAGKIDKNVAPTVLMALSAACSGIDYVFVKYPKAKDVEELVTAAVQGFIDGFKSIGALAVTDNVTVDNDAYMYVKKHM